MAAIKYQPDLYSLPFYGHAVLVRYDRATLWRAKKKLSPRNMEQPREHNWKFNLNIESTLISLPLHLTLQAARVRDCFTLRLAHTHTKLLIYSHYFFFQFRWLILDFVCTESFFSVRRDAYIALTVKLCQCKHWIILFFIYFFSSLQCFGWDNSFFFLKRYVDVISSLESAPFSLFLFLFF